MLQENKQLASLQAEAALSAKARARVEEEELQTARWIKRLSYTQRESDRRAKMLATTSVDVDLFVSKTAKIIVLEADSPEDAERQFEIIAQMKSTGEIPADQEFNIILPTDAVRLFQWVLLPNI